MKLSNWYEERIEELETMLRESLNKTGDGEWHDRVHRVLGEPKPSVRILTGKIPRYQQEQINAGTLRLSTDSESGESPTPSPNEEQKLKVKLRDAGRVEQPPIEEDPG